MEQGLQHVLTLAWYASARRPELLTQLSHMLWFPDLFAWGRYLKGLYPYTAHQAKLWELLHPLHSGQPARKGRKLLPTGAEAEVVQKQCISPWGKNMVCEEKSVEPDFVV